MKTSIYTITAFFILLAFQLNGFDMPKQIDAHDVCLFSKPTGNIEIAGNLIYIECNDGTVTETRVIKL